MGQRRFRKRYDLVKRVLDVVGATSGLIILSPVLGATALAVRINLGKPVLFKQKRPGRDGRIFTLLKFRTMLDAPPTPIEVDDDAERMTPFGTKLRALSLDELPSLWNVLRGDMSIVGPRPLVVEYLPLYSAEQARRHEVRPGVTGLAQVNGRNDLNWVERFRMDVDYVDRRSFWLDLTIVLSTFAAVFGRKGISADDHVSVQPFTGTP